MPKYKNISGGAVDLVVPGFEAHVEDGEIVDIPAFQSGGDPADPAMAIVPPPNRWEPVTGTKAPAAKSDSGKAAS